MKKIPIKPITFRPPGQHRDLERKLKEIARQQTRSLSNLITTILVEYIEKKKNPE